MVVRLARFNHRLFATHIFDATTKHYRELNPDTDTHVARACAHKLGVKMAGHYLWPLVATEKAGSWNLPVEGSPLLLARVCGMSSVFTDQYYTFDDKLYREIQRVPDDKLALVPRAQRVSDGSWQIAARFNPEQQLLIYNNQHCIRVMIKDNPYNVYRDLIMLPVKSEYDRSMVVGELRIGDDDDVVAVVGPNIIGPLSPASIALAKEKNFKIDYEISKTPGMTLVVEFKVTIAAKEAKDLRSYSYAYSPFSSSSYEGGRGEDSDDDDWYDSYDQVDPYFTRKFFFPHMDKVPADYWQLIEDKIRPLVLSDFADDEVKRCVSYEQPTLIKILDVTAVSRNGQQLPMPRSSYYLKSDEDWAGDDPYDPRTKLYQFTVKRC